MILSQIELVSFAHGLFTLYAEEKAKEKKLTFHFHTDREKIYIQMDAIKLESILDNLLSNAVKYTPEAGEITLRLQASDKEVYISVSDTGIGVPCQDQPHVFQRFFQSPKTAGKKEGTGIGLYLVKTYTELHGGNVLLSSEENKGTTIMLTLPVIAMEESVVEISAETASFDVEPIVAGTSIVIPDTDTPAPDAPLLLIVDDTPEVAEFIYQILHTQYRCRLADNGKVVWNSLWN